MKVFGLSFLCIVCCMIFCSPAQSDSAKKHALLISSYHPGFPTFFKQIDGIESILKPANVDLDIEFMDSKRFHSERSQQRFYDLISGKLELLEHYDVIITSDDNALHFALNHRENLFPNTPIVFCGVNDIALGEKQAANPLITGVLEATSRQDTLNLITHLYPQSDIIYALSDDTTSGKADRQSISAMQSVSGAHVKVLSLEDVSWDEMGKKLGKLTPGDPLLILSAYVDSNGQRKSFEESLKWIQKQTSAPLFHLWEHGLGDGVLGGKIVSHFQQGAFAGKIVLEILNGKPVSEIAIVDPQMVNEFIFDYQALEKHKIQIDALPIGARIINQPKSPLDDYYVEFVVSAMGLLSLLLITVVSISYSFKLRKSRKSERFFREQFQAIFNNAAAGIAALTPDGQFVNVNKIFLDILGYEKDELYALTRQEITHPDDMESDAHDMQKLLAGDIDSFSKEKRLQNKNGEYIWVHISVGLIRGKNDAPKWTVAVVENITSRKILEQVMDFRTQFLRDVSKKSLHYMLVQALDFAEELVESSVSFFHFVEEKEQFLSLQAWSTQTSNTFCNYTGDRPQKYPISDAGIWMEAYHKRQPVIHNDVDSHPNRKGAPEGHPKIERELVIPILRDNKVVAVLGVGNKHFDYTEADVRSLSFLVDILWEVIEQKKAYETLQTSEEKFSKVFEKAPIMITLSRLCDGTYVDANNCYLQVTGFKREEIIGKTSIDVGFITHEQRTALLNEIDNHGAIRDHQLSLKGANGRQIEVAYNGEIVKVEDEEYLLSLARDVTDRVIAQKKAIETETRYQQLFNAGSDAILVHPYVDHSSLPLLEANEAACAMLGLSVEELRKLSLDDILATSSLTSSQSRSAKEELSQTGYALYVSKFVPKVGPPISVEIASRVFSVSEKKYVLSIARDITARIAVENEKERLSQDYHGLFSKMLEGFAMHEIICDEQGVPSDYKFLAVNPAFENLTGLKAVDVIGNTVRQILPDIETVWIERFGEVALTGEATIFDQYSELLERHFLVTAFQNAPMQFACIFTDVTEQKMTESTLKKAKEAAEKANEIKSNFLATMSHEIRTPLNGISGMLQLLNATSLNADQHEFIDAATVSAKRLTKLLCDILDHARIETGHLSIDNDIFCFEDIAKHMSEMFATTAKNGGIDFDIFLDDDISPRLAGDANRLAQVFGNLLGNAFKFTEHGSVSFSIHKMPSLPEKCRVLCIVEDTGIGIPDNKMSYLFSPFTQVSEGYTRKFEGAGLGLSICKQLVHLMGGQICFVSEEQKGTAMYVSLGFDIVNQNNALENSPLTRTPSFDDRRIMIVEDDKVNRHVLQRIVEMTGATTHCVEDGKTAIETLNENHFDLILMDIQMPIMDGVEATQAIRRGEAGQMNSSIPIVALTAYAMKEDKNRFLNAGMNEYLTKPFDQDKLFSILSSLLIK